MKAVHTARNIALRKAKTALLFKLPTRVIGELSRPELKDKGPLYGIEISNSNLITFPGGLPLMDAKGNCVGAIGVSGDNFRNHASDHARRHRDLHD